VDITARRCGETLIDDDQVILEIKVNGDQPDWMVEILNRYQVEEISFSKYGRIILGGNDAKVEYSNFQFRYIEIRGCTI